MVTPKKATKKGAQGRGRPSTGCSEVLYVRVTPATLKRLLQCCSDHHKKTGIRASPPEMVRKILADHFGD